MTKIDKIKLIIFDAGGTAYIGAFPALCKFLADKYRLEYKKVFEVVYIKYFDLACARKITQQEAWQRTIADLQLPITVSEIKKIYYRGIKLNKPAIDYVKDKFPGVAMAILSKNTRSAMHDTAKKLNLKKYFQYLINTWEIKLPKTSPETMAYILKRFKLKPEEIIFIDDEEKNLVEAKKIGIKTVLYKDLDQFKKQLIRFV